MSNSCGSGVSNAATLNVIQTPAIIPTASISGPNPACANINALYTINTNINGGSYQWMLNNSLVSTNQTYAFQPASGDHLYAIVTASNNGNLGCYSLPTAVSNQMTIGTGNNFLPTAAVSANKTNVCDGTQINFILQTNVYGGSYQWHVNGSNTGINSPGYTYVPSNGDQVSCTIMTPSNGCYNLSSVTSLPVAVTTMPSITPVVNLSSVSSASSGSHVNLNLNILNLNANYYVLWYLNGVLFDSTTTPVSGFVKGQGTDYVKAKVYPQSDENTGACYYDVYSNQVTITNSTASVNNVAGESNVKVYPNPFNKEIMVRGLEPGDKVSVYDVTGRMVSEVWKIESKEEQKFDISNIVAGTYFLKVVNNNGNAKALITLQKL
jgi:hypothetical protein